MMRTCAFENQCFVAFAHPRRSLVVGPDGQVLAGWENSDDMVADGVTVFNLGLGLARSVFEGHLVDRRPELYWRLTASG